MNGLSAEWPLNEAPARNALADLAEAVALRLFLERDDLSRSIEAEDPHRRRVVDRDRLRRDGDVGAALDVRVNQLAVVHPVEMVAGEDQVVLGVVAHQVARRLAHRVGGALIPVRVVRRLLGREDLHEPWLNGSIR